MGRFNLTKLSSGERFIIDKTLGLNNIRVELTWQTEIWMHKRGF